MQLQSGNLFGTVTDNRGPLPGVTVTVTGEGAPQEQVTDAEGRFRFLGLQPDSYTVKAQLEGYSFYINSNVVINIGRKTKIKIVLSPVN